MWSDKKKATQGCGSKKILNQLQAHDTLVAALGDEKTIQPVL
jgi:hypothetical protein